MRKFLHKLGFHYWKYGEFLANTGPFALMGMGVDRRHCQLCPIEQAGKTYATFDGIETHWADCK